MHYDNECAPPAIRASIGIRSLLARTLNKNQHLILLNLKNGSAKSITSFLWQLSATHGVALSTLKYNSRVLRDLGIIDFKGPKLTGLGHAVIEVLESEF